MIVNVLFVHKKSVWKRKVCIIFIKNKKKTKKRFLVGFFRWVLWFFFGWVFWVGFFYCHNPACRSPSERIGFSNHSLWQHAPGPGSRMLPSGPIGQASDITIFSRNGSIGGFVTWAQGGLRIRIHSMRIRIQHFRLNTPIRIQACNEQKFKKKFQLKKK